MSNNPRLKIGAKTVAEADLPSIQKKKAGKSSIDLTFFQDPWMARCGYLMMANSSSFKKKRLLDWLHQIPPMTTRRDPYGIRVQEFTQFGKLQDQHHRAAQPPLQSLVIELLAFISALFWFCRCVRTRAQLLASCYCIARTSWKNVKRK